MKWPILLTILFIISCKKDDETPPKLEIDTPINQQVYSYSDYIHVTGLARDETALATISYEIWNEGLTSRVKQFTQVVKGDAIEIDHYMALDDVRMTSGQYYLKVVASDGENQNSDFTLFSYIEAQKAVVGIFLLKEDIGSVHLYKENNNQFDYQNFVGNDSTTFEIDSWNQNLIFAGSVNEGIRSLAYPSYQINWHITPSIGQTSEWLTFFQFDEGDRKSYVSFSDGFKRIINSNGTTEVLMNQSSIGWIGEEQVQMANQTILVDEYNGSSNQLATYFSSTGAFSGSQAVAFNTISMMENESILGVELFAENQGDFKIYRFLNGAVTGPFQGVLGELCYDVERIDGDTYALALSSAIYIYNSSTNSLNQIDLISAIDLEYETISNTIYYVHQNGVNQIDLSGNLINSISVLNGIDLEILYNK